MNTRLFVFVLAMFTMLAPFVAFGQDIPQGKSWNLCYVLTQDCSNSHTRILEVKDGDTVQLDTDWLPKVLNDNFSLRIVGIDTPEKDWRAQCERENDLGHQATKFTTDALWNAKVITVNITGWDKFGGRIDGELILDGVKLADMLMNKGLAKPFTGKEKKQSWCK